MFAAPQKADAALSVVQFPTVPLNGTGAWYINNVDTTRTFGSDTTSGNLIVVMIETWGGGAVSVTDNKGNIYTQALQTANGNARVAIFYAENITGGASHQVTADLTTGGYGVFTMIEVAGAATSGALDSGATASANTNTDGSGNSSVTTGALAQADSIAFALASADVDAPHTVSSPWSSNVIWSRDDFSNDATGHASYQIVSATTALTATWNVWPNRSQARGIAVFKADNAAAAPAVSTVAASHIVANGAQLNGLIVLAHGSNSTARGFAWGTNASLSGGDTATTTENGSFGEGAFSYQATGLTNGSTYYVRAYATNDTATGYGAIQSFVQARRTLIKPPNKLSLALYYPFDEGKGSTFRDFSGNGRHGVLGFGSPGWADGKRINAYNFSSQDRIDTPYISDATVTTYSMWLYPTSGGDDFAVLAIDGNTDSVWLCTQAGVDCSVSNAISFHNRRTGSNADWYSPAGSVPQNTWTHVVIIYDRSSVSNDPVIYINGVSVPVSNPTGDGVGAVFPGAVLQLGGSGTFNYVGRMDEFRIYTRALSASEALVLAKNGSATFSSNSAVLTQGSSLEKGLVGLWTFDGGDTNWTSATAGTTADKSGNGNTGTMTNMTRKGSVDGGKLGQAFKFDGSSYIDAGSGASLDNLTNGNASSFAFWINPSAQDNVILAKNDGNVVNAGFWIENTVSTNDQGVSGLRFVIERATTNLRAGAASPSNGAWTHVVVTYAGDLTAANVKIYYNGVLQALTTSIDGVGVQGTDAAETMYIGNNRPTSATGASLSKFAGKMDDVRIYNRALSVAEVKQLYLLGGVKAR